jgi:hypothetical protein
MINDFWSPSVVRWAQWNGSVIEIVRKICVQNIVANHLSKQTSKQRVRNKMNHTDVSCEDGSYMERIHDQIQCLSLSFLVFVQHSYLTIIALCISLDSVREVVCTVMRCFLNVKKLDRV